MPLNAFVAQIQNQITFTFSHFCSYSRASSRLDVVICFFFRRRLSISYQQITKKLSKTFINKSHMMVHFKLAQNLCCCCYCDGDLQQNSKHSLRLMDKTQNFVASWNSFIHIQIYFENDFSSLNRICLLNMFLGNAFFKLPQKKKLCVLNVTQCSLSTSDLAMRIRTMGLNRPLLGMARKCCKNESKKWCTLLSIFSLWQLPTKP